MLVRYDEPHRAARAANTLIRWLAELGISIAGTRALSVRGRKTGKQRSVVINVLTINDVDYLVSPRGTTQMGAQCPSRRHRRRRAPLASAPNPHH
jgi:hypothetical protein